MSLRLSWKTLLATVCCLALTSGCAPWKPWANQKAAPQGHAAPRQAIRENHDDLDRLLATEHAPEDPKARPSTFSSLNVFSGNGDKQNAAKEAAIEQELALARLGERRGQSEGAKRVYLKLIEQYPDHPVAYHRLGVIYAKEKNFDEANQYLEFAVGMDAPSIEILNDLGYCYYLQSRYDDAEKVLRVAQKQKPNHEKTCNNLGLVLGGQGRFAEAFEVFSRVNSEAESHANLAYVFSQQGDLANARQGYLEALSRDRTLREAALAVIQVDQRLKQQEQQRERIANNQQGAPPSLPEGYNLPPRGQQPPAPQQAQQPAAPPAIAQRPQQTAAPPAVAQRPEQVVEQRPAQRSAQQPPQIAQQMPEQKLAPAPRAVETLPPERVAIQRRLPEQPSAPREDLPPQMSPLEEPPAPLARTEPIAPKVERPLAAAPQVAERQLVERQPAVAEQRVEPSPAPRMTQAPPPVVAAAPERKPIEAAPSSRPEPKSTATLRPALDAQQHVTQAPPRATAPFIIPPMQSKFVPAAEPVTPPAAPQVTPPAAPQELVTSQSPATTRKQPAAPPAVATTNPYAVTARPPQRALPVESPATNLPRVPLVHTRPQEVKTTQVVQAQRPPQPTVVEPKPQQPFATQDAWTPSPRALEAERPAAPVALQPVPSPAPAAVANLEPRATDDRSTFRPTTGEDRSSFEPVQELTGTFEPIVKAPAREDQAPRKLTFDPSLTQPQTSLSHSPEVRPQPQVREPVAAAPLAKQPGSETRAQSSGSGRSQLASLGRSITTGALVTSRKPTSAAKPEQPRPAATTIAARPTEARPSNPLPPIVSADNYHPASANASNNASINAPTSASRTGLSGFVRTSQPQTLPPIISAEEHSKWQR